MFVIETNGKSICASFQQTPNWMRMKSSASMEKDGISKFFFKVCKSYLHMSKECRSISYDAMTAHTAVVFTRYMMLSLESRESNDERSLGELFLYFSDEMSDITWVQAFQLLLQMFRALLAANLDIADDKIDELVDTFMNSIPAVLKSKLQAA